MNDTIKVCIIEDEGNISTAYDMAILMKYCMNNDLFQEIISTKKYQFRNRVYYNKNKLLNTYDYYLGGKTGVGTIFCVI